jgi:NADP-dependent 3-hydroxy acid dehydrogenase YdfG
MDVSGFALITGAASGIGRTCASDSSMGALQAWLCSTSIQMLRLKPCQVVNHVVNIAEEDCVEQVVHDVSKSFGRIHRSAIDNEVA